MNIELIGVDIDGTLVTPERTISPKVKETVALAKSKGIKVVLCTGRPLPGVLPLLKELNLEEEGDYVITYNGALVQKSHNGEILAHHTLNYDDYRALFNLSQEAGLHCHAVNDNGVYTSNKDISYYSVRESYLTTVPLRYRSMEEMDSDILISKMMMVDPPEVMEKGIQQLPKDLWETYTVLRSEPFFLEVLNKRASKGQALKDLADILGVPQEKVMAIGDNENDLDMLEYAGYGVAMGNAVQKAKDASNYVTDSNIHDGVATAIEKYALS